MPLFQALGSSVLHTAGRTATWALDLKEPESHSRLRAALHPLRQFGFERYDNQWTFLNRRLGSGPNWWIPDMADTAGKAGRWGTAGEYGSAFKSVWKTRGVGTSARMLGRQYLPAIFGLGFGTARILGGENVAGVVASEVGEAVAISMAARVLPFLSNPWLLLPVAAYAGISGYMGYRNKMKEFRQRVRQTEFIGDMSAFQTDAAVTMRQRSQQAIERNFLSARRSLGNEAQYFHQPNSYGWQASPGIWGP